jgi:hypothetical protein
MLRLAVQPGGLPGRRRANYEYERLLAVGHGVFSQKRCKKANTVSQAQRQCGPEG